MTGVVELLDLPDELILYIMNKVNPRALLLCSMIGISNNRLKELAFSRCHSIDLSFDYCRAAHTSLMQKFYSDVMPRISNDIRTLTINFRHISSMKSFLEYDSNGTLPNVRHLKIIIGAIQQKTGIPYTISKLLISFFYTRFLYYLRLFFHDKRHKFYHLILGNVLVDPLGKRNSFFGSLVEKKNTFEYNQ